MPNRFLMNEACHLRQNTVSEYRQILPSSESITQFDKPEEQR
jgi:hypothetical protein